MITLFQLDDISAVHGVYGHGLSVDGQSDPCIPFRCVPNRSLTSQRCRISRLMVFAGGVPPHIYGDIGGSDRWIWFVSSIASSIVAKLMIFARLQVLANLLALSGVCPFVGSLSDLIGRRYVAIIGATLVCIGMIVCSTANTMNMFIGMYIEALDPFDITRDIFFAFIY